MQKLQSLGAFLATPITLIIRMFFIKTCVRYRLAQSTEPSAIVSRLHCFVILFVAISAISCSLYDGGDGVTAKDINLRSYSLQVVRINAMSDTAEMVNFKSIRDVAFENFIGNAMRKSALMMPSGKESSIATIVLRSCPFPTMSDVVDMDFPCESVFNSRTYFGNHIEEYIKEAA